MNHSINFTYADLVRANDQKALTLLPVMLTLFMYMVIGILGNTLVCYVFIFRLKPGTQNIFIIYLAAFDLLSCAVAIPGDIADLRFTYNFTNALACKLMKSVTFFTIVGSIVTLLFIAIDRYLKICHPFGYQLSLTHTKLCLIPILCVAAFISSFSWPTTGIASVQTGIAGLNGTQCDWSEDTEDLNAANQGTMGISFFLLTFVMIAMYCSILHTVRKQSRLLKYHPSSGAFMLRKSNFKEGGNETNSTSHVSSCTTKSSHMKKTKSGEHTSETCRDSSRCLEENENEENFPNIDVESYDRGEKEDVSTSVHCDAESGHHFAKQDDTSTQGFPSLPPKSPSTTVTTQQGRGASTKSNRKKNKTTKVAFIVTLVFLLSFVPHICLHSSKLAANRFTYKLDGASLVVFELFVRSYYINCIANPIIYGILNQRFKDESRLMFHGLTRLCKCNFTPV